MKKRIASRGLSTLLSLMLVLGMLPVFGVGALAATADDVVSAIEAIGSDAITKENFNAKSAAIERAKTAYNAWKAENTDAPDTDISNYEALQTAQAAYADFLTDLTGVEYKNYSPEDLLKIAQETSVSGAATEELAGVVHSGAAGALYEGIVTNYLGKPNYTYETKESYITNNTNADTAYIYENTSASNAGLRYCDGDKYLIYKFDLSKFNNLCVSVNICQNYVLEAAGDPDGPWTLIADYGVIGGGTRIEGESNKQVYDILFADLGITGTGYIRLSNVGGTGGWGGAISKLTLSEAVLAGDSYLFNPTNRVRIEVDADIAGAGANDEVLTTTIANGSYTQSASINGSEFEALSEQTNHIYGYTYRTVSAQVRLPSAEDDAALAENLKKQGFTLSLSSAAAVERKIYRIAFINETTGATILELTGQDLLDAASATSAPAAIRLMPSAYQPFSPAIALRSYEGSDWYTIIDMRSPYQDEFGNPLMHAGDEIEYSVDIFIEGSDTENLPGGNAARMVAKLDKDPEDTTVGIVLDSDVIISASEYNEAELMMDEEHYYEPYKRFTRSFTIPEDSESEEKVQSTGFKMLVGTHMLPKEDYPFRIYSMTLYNISTDTVILYADADSLSTTAAQGAREALTDEDILGGIAGKRVNGYGDSVLVNGGFETLPAGMYSYEFFYTTIGNNGVDKAALSAVTENGTVLNSKIVTDYYNGVYKTTRLVFSVTEETKVGFKIDLYNNTDFYLKSVTLNQMLSASEVAIQRVINAINELPSVEDLTLDNATAVASVQRLYDRLTDEQKAAVTNAEKLEQAANRIGELERQAAEDAAAAESVDDVVNALPALKDLAKADQSKVEAARNAYDALNERQKPLVTALSVLEAAEARMALLKAASDEDIAAAKAVDDKIDALPAVDELQYDDKEQVDEARAAYDALSENQRKLVIGLPTLEAAEAKLAALAPNVVYGDINSDTKIDASDALLSLQHSVKLKTLEGDSFVAADVDGNDKVDASDALLILQYSVKLIDHFPVED